MAVSSRMGPHGTQSDATRARQIWRQHAERGSYVRMSGRGLPGGMVATCLVRAVSWHSAHHVTGSQARMAKVATTGVVTVVAGGRMVFSASIAGVPQRRSANRLSARCGRTVGSGTLRTSATCWPSVAAATRSAGTRSWLRWSPPDRRRGVARIDPDAHRPLPRSHS